MPETRNLANFTVRSLILERITILLEQHYPYYILNFIFKPTDKGTHHPSSKKHLFYSKWRSLQTTTIGNPQRSTNHGVPSPIKDQQIVGCQPQWIHLCHKPVSIQGTLWKGAERFQEPEYRAIWCETASPGNGYINRARTKPTSADMLICRGDIPWGLMPGLRTLGN